MAYLAALALTRFLVEQCAAHFGPDCLDVGRGSIAARYGAALQLCDYIVTVGGGGPWRRTPPALPPVPEDARVDLSDLQSVFRTLARIAL
jgi:hypothetical protein